MYSLKTTVQKISRKRQRICSFKDVGGCLLQSLKPINILRNNIIFTGMLNPRVETIFNKSNIEGRNIVVLINKEIGL